MCVVCLGLFVFVFVYLYCLFDYVVFFVVFICSSVFLLFLLSGDCCLCVVL